MIDCKCMKAVLLKRDKDGEGEFMIGDNWITNYEHRYFRVIR